MDVHRRLAGLHNQYKRVTVVYSYICLVMLPSRSSTPLLQGFVRLVKFCKVVASLSAQEVMGVDPFSYNLGQLKLWQKVVHL